MSTAAHLLPFKACKAFSVNEVRSSFMSYFEKQGHTVAPQVDGVASMGFGCDSGQIALERHVALVLRGKAWAGGIGLRGGGVYGFSLLLKREHAIEFIRGADADFLCILTVFKAAGALLSPVSCLRAARRRLRPTAERSR